MNIQELRKKYFYHTRVHWSSAYFNRIAKLIQDFNKLYYTNITTINFCCKIYMIGKGKHDGTMTNRRNYDLISWCIQEIEKINKPFDSLLNDTLFKPNLIRTLDCSGDIARSNCIRFRLEHTYRDVPKRTLRRSRIFNSSRDKLHCMLAKSDSYYNSYMTTVVYPSEVVVLFQPSRTCFRYLKPMSYDDIADALLLAYSDKIIETIRDALIIRFTNRILMPNNTLLPPGLLQSYLLPRINTESAGAYYPETNIFCTCHVIGSDNNLFTGSPHTRIP